MNPLVPTFMDVLLAILLFSIALLVIFLLVRPRRFKANFTASVGVMMGLGCGAILLGTAVFASVAGILWLIGLSLMLAALILVLRPVPASTSNSSQE